jgi:hypothetical protein
MFGWIEMFDNPRGKHTNNGMLSPVDFETGQQKRNEVGVWKTRGHSLQVFAIAIFPFSLRAPHMGSTQVIKGLAVRHVLHSSALVDEGFAAGHQLFGTRHGVCRCRTCRAAS